MTEARLHHHTDITINGEIIIDFLQELLQILNQHYKSDLPILMRTLDLLHKMMYGTIG